MRRLADGIRPLLDGFPDGPLKESYPDWIYDVLVRDLGADGALALMRAMNEPLETVVRLVRGDPPAGAEPTDVPGAYRRRAGRRPRRRRRTDLAAEPRLAARRARRRLAGRRARARPLRRAGRQDDAAPRRGDGGRDRPAPGERAAGQPRAPACAPTSPSSRRTGRSCRRNSTASTARSSTRRAPVSACSRSGRTCAGARRPLPELQLALLRSAAERVRPGGTIVYSVCTMNAERERGRRRRERAARPAARGGVAGVRAPAAAGVPPHAAARPRHDAGSSSPGSHATDADRR